MGPKRQLVLILLTYIILASILLQSGKERFEAPEADLNDPKVAVVCIQKKEDPYIVEWVKHNLIILKADAIIIYDNNEDSTTLPAIIQNGLTPELLEKVTIIHWPERQAQEGVYNNALVRFRSRYPFLLIIDCDEFLVLKKHTSLVDLIKDKLVPYIRENKACALGINWVLFGDSGLTEANVLEPVVKRFIRCENAVNQHIKSLVYSPLAERYAVHEPECAIVDTNGKIFTGTFNPDGPIDVAQINHYFGKTRPEFEVKRLRGMADRDNLRNPEEFDAHNKNDIEDLTLYNQHKNAGLFS